MPSAFPLRAAVISGVSPLGIAAFGSAPALMSRSIIAPFPVWVASARYRGVTPYRLTAATRRPVERRRAVGFGRVHVALRQGEADRLRVAGLGGIDHWSRGPGRAQI